MPAGKKTTLRLVVGSRSARRLRFDRSRDGQELLRKPVSRPTCHRSLAYPDVDLSAFAGSEVNLELVNQPSDWSYEAAYWAEIAVVSE